MKLLKEKQVLRTRALWEAIFSTDSKEFVDYYYTYKAKKNDIFVIEAENEIISMLHLTPYEAVVKAGDRRIAVSYIVGVATKEAYRHRGYMATLLLEAFSYMYQKRQPFTFLMPANPAIYEPFGFRYIYDRAVYHLNTQIRDEKLRIKRMEANELADVIVFANEQLKEKFDLYLYRDEEYYVLLEKELQSENGAVFLIYKKEELIGVYLYAQEDEESFIQEVILSKDCENYELFIEEKKKKPIIMARIICIEEMGKLCLLNKNAPENSIMLTFNIEDKIINENNGIFEWHIGKNESYIKNITTEFFKSHGQENCDIVTTIENLSEFLFGYEPIDVCFPNISVNIKQKLTMIDCIQSKYINEIV